MVYQVIHTALDFLFPPRCIACREENFVICPACIQKISSLGDECLFCARRGSALHLCEECRGKRPLDGIVWPWRYNNDTTKKIIAAYKYRKKRWIATALATHLKQSIASLALTERLIVIPVPLHPRKERERGFNQALLIAKSLGYPVRIDAVRRTKETSPQAWTESRTERIDHMRGAFSVEKSESISGKTILLVDDVTTTGATLSELARTLKESGAAKIYAAVLAHG